MQPSFVSLLESGMAQTASVPKVALPAPAWYRTPVAVIPFAAAAFIIGNVLMMVPWSVF
jgi:hypothetical protein